MNYNLTMKLLGYYTSKDQFMRPESRFPDEVIVLADLFKKTFEETFTPDVLDSIKEKQFIEDYHSNTVFILRDMEGNLYAYHPKEGTARISGVSYSKKTITFVPRYMGRWFTLGSKIDFYSETSPKVNKEASEYVLKQDEYGFMDWIKSIFPWNRDGAH